MRRAGTLVLLLLARSVAAAELATDVARAFRGDEAPERAAGLRALHAAVTPADERERNKAAAAVERALRDEPAPEVRMAALDLLLELRTSRALDRLVAGVLDRAPEVVAHVHGIVRDRADPALFDAVVRALREDASWRMRAEMVGLLLSAARERCRPPLLEALGDSHPAVVAAAAEALERLTGQAFGVDRDRWEEWVIAEAKRAAAAAGPAETVTVAGADRKVKLKEGPIEGLVPTLFTIPIVEKQVIFVVDMSSSMRQGSRSTHFTELKQAIWGLPSDVHFNLLCFDDRMFFLTEAKELLPATLEGKESAARWIDALPAGRKTDVQRSVASGLAMLKEALLADPKARAELFIVTDGRETAASLSPDAVENQFQKLPPGRCRVHIVALGNHTTPSLRQLAQRSGGRFVEAPGR